jgi:hypothetical protein
MSQPLPMESRIAVLIAAYADQAPTGVDPIGMARLAAGSKGATSGWSGVAAPSRALLVAIIALAVLASLVSGAFIVGAGPFRPDPADILTERAFVEPFTGVPPEGTVPSAPATGELVLSFDGRVSRFGGDHFRMWLFADGRLIWKSDLEGAGEMNPAFGTAPPTTAFIEQRLTPEGVRLMRSLALASGRVDGPVDYKVLLPKSGPGIHTYGSAALGGTGGELSRLTWSDPRLPERLADPGSWLPSSAWADRRIGGFVPAEYAVCVGLDRAWSDHTERELARLPLAVQALVTSSDTATKGTELTGKPWQPDGCAIVSLHVGRQIVASLEAAGGGTDDPYGMVRHVIRDEPTSTGDVFLDLWPILPHGEVVCNCG